MFNAIKSLFGASEKKESNPRHEKITSQKLITYETVEDAKSKFIKDYIEKFEWRKSPFKLEDDEKEKIFTIVYYIQVYNILSVLKNREYIDIIVDKYNKLSYTDDYGDLITDRFEREMISFARHK